MQQTEKIYRDMAFAGYKGDIIADNALRDAVDVLISALSSCVEDDVRQRQELHDAISYLQYRIRKPYYCRLFLKALDRRHPVERYSMARMALRDIIRDLGR